MFKKISKFFVAFLLALSIFSNVYVAKANEVVANGTTTSTLNEDKMRVFSVDAGRKYFSKARIKKIITRIAELKYTDFHLLFGNDGFRFLLNDLSIEVDGERFDHDTVKNAILEGNKQYSTRKQIKSTHDLYLTQEDMDEILNYAAEQNIRIIPGFNSPGHMDALVTAIKQLGVSEAEFEYNGNKSKTTVSLLNQKALKITKALFQKYVDYFKTKKHLGIEIFNFGADEYGQDVTFHINQGPSGFKAMQQLGQYDAFVSYVNELSTIVKTAGFKPMAFNDGFYYNGVEPTTHFDTDIIISYWTPGFARYEPASARTLVDKGFKILNTNDAWYFALGSFWYTAGNAMINMSNVKFDKVAGDTTNVPIIGSMLAYWSDEPSSAYNYNILDSLVTTFKNQNEAIFVDKPIAKTYTQEMNTVENVIFNSELELSVEKITTPQITAFEGKDVALYDISFKDAATKQKVDIGTGDYTVNLVRDVAKQVEKVVYVNDALQVEEIPFTLTDTHVVFKTTHFSTYGIVYKTEDKQTTQPSTEVKPEAQPSTETGQITKVETPKTVENVDTSDVNATIYTVMMLLSAVTLLFFKKKVD